MRLKKSNASRYLSSQKILTKPQSSFDWAMESLEVRQTSFFSAHVSWMSILSAEKQHLVDLLDGARQLVTLEDGTESTTLKAGFRAKFVADMKEKFSWGPDEGAGSVRDKTSTTRLGLIYDTKVKQSYGYAQEIEASDPDIADAYPGYLFTRGGFVQEPRPLHEAHDGEIHLADDPFWVEMNAFEIGGFSVPYPPFGYNSMMVKIPQTRQQCIDAGVLYPGQQVTPQKVKPMTDGLSYSVADWSEEERANALREMGAGNAEIRGGMIYWLGKGEKTTEVKVG